MLYIFIIESEIKAFFQPRNIFKENLRPLRKIARIIHNTKCLAYFLSYFLRVFSRSFFDSITPQRLLKIGIVTLNAISKIYHEGFAPVFSALNVKKKSVRKVPSQVFENEI